MALTISTKRNSMLIYIIGIGLLTGTLDALGAVVSAWNIPADSIFRYIASGIFGKAAFTGGDEMVVWGVLFHYATAFAFTTIFFLLHPMFYSWFRNSVITAIFYGIIIWAVMNLAIVPLSHIQPHPLALIPALKACSILIVCLGLPISLIATDYYFYKAK